MSELQQQVEQVEQLRDSQERDADPDCWDACDAAVKALLACEAIRRLVREAHDEEESRIDVDLIESVLP